MASIGLNQIIQGAFTSTDPKTSNSEFYDEYDLPTNLVTYSNISIVFDPINTSNNPNTPGITTVSLINAATNAVLDTSTSNGFASGLTGLGKIDQTIAPGTKYKIRVANSSLSNGNYSLSLTDEGAATSLLSFSFLNVTGRSAPQFGTVNTAGKYFPLVKIGYTPADVALSSNGLVYGVTPSLGLLQQADRLFVTAPSSGSTSNNYKDIKDTAGNKLLQSLNSLAFSDTEKLYSIGTSATGAGSLYQIDTASFVATSLGSLPTGLNNVGDLVYDAANSRFFAVSQDTGLTDALWSVPLANPGGATKIGQVGSKGITGLSFEGGQLIGFKNPANLGSVDKVSINTTTGVGNVIQSIPNINGSGVTGASTLVYPGQLSLADFKKDPAKYMEPLRDYDGNNIGSSSSWKLLGDVDIQGDGDLESILVNPAIGRFASVGSIDGKVDFSKYGLNGDTRVVGIYIDPTLKDKPQNIGGPFDSQRRFQADLQKDNLKLLAAGDYDKDGSQDLYFKLGDGSAVLRALMFKDGNIQYANYQSKSDLSAFMTANNVSSSVWGGWI